MTTAATDDDAKCYALVPCAGVGERAGAGGPKQYRLLAGQAVVARTLATLACVPAIEQTLVVLAPGDLEFEASAPHFTGWAEPCGGASRAASVAAGLDALTRRGVRDHDWVLVHDAARCLVSVAAILRLVEDCNGDAVGGLLALPLADTLKQAGPGDRAEATIDRRGKWTAQTPQMFRLGLLRDALRRAGSAVTDEASAVEALGHAPRLVPGEPDNIKLTWPADFVLAQRLLQDAAMPTITSPVLRLGEGWDTHALVTGRPLVLGGVTIPHSHGLAGHSDADALAHAITDALLGAAALGDIGRHFPDTNAAFAGADSLVLLTEAARRVRAAGFDVVNVDSTIVAQAPKMAPHIDAMRAKLANALGVAVAQVNVKAKTAEKMGPVGEGRAIEARAVCLLQAR
ncbi:MAG: 2-C-methyl-D-erythritol 2,4-cyclodiphosphate synthase [Burkholderiaceae bacterium]